jgi:predicted dehydrogenase
MNELGVGIVGTGWVSDEYIRSFVMNPHTHIRGICSRSGEKAAGKIAQHRLKDCVPYTDYEKMAASPNIDIMAVLTPNFKHAEQTVIAAEEKKHIIIEKPLAINWDDMKKMQKSVHDNSVKTIVGFVLRWNPLFKTAKEFIKRDVIGKPFYAEVDYLHAITPDYPCYPWSVKKETGGSILQVGGCHAVDGLRWFMQQDAVEVTAMSGRYRDDFEQDTTVTLITKFVDGSMGKVCCSYDVVCPYIYNLKLFGDKGTLINDKVWSKNAFPGQNDWITIPTTTPDSGDVSHHPFPDEVNHFVDTILDDTPCIVDIDDAMKTFEIIEAADRSAMNHGASVKLPLVD